MKAKNLLLCLPFILQSFYSLAQAPPEEFMAGLKLVLTDKKAAKQDFLTAINKQPEYFGSYHFLGTIYLGEHKLDSAIACFKKSIALNTGNIAHTREMTYTRLAYSYNNQLDFKNAFSAALEASKLYPDNKSVMATLKDICLWAYYINHNGLNKAYLSSEPKEEYQVATVQEEYIIMRNLRVNDENVLLTTQRLVNKNGASYDVFDCTLSSSKTPLTLIFKLNWDLSKFFGGIQGPAEEVKNDKKAPIYERAGAALVADMKSDIKTVLEGLQ